MASEPLTPEDLEAYEQHAQRLLARGHEVYPDYNAVIILNLIEEVRRLKPPPGEKRTEYGVTTKWGISRYGADKYGAMQYARILRESIARGGESGDLTYHGEVVQRTAYDPNPWVPVEGDNPD
jgi:hypothetical protein